MDPKTKFELIKEADNLAGWLDTLVNPDMAVWRKKHGFTPEDAAPSVMLALREWRAVRDRATKPEPAPRIGRPKGAKNGTHKPTGKRKHKSASNGVSTEPESK